MTENEIANVVVDSAIEVHRPLGGPGLLETVYEEALAFELESRGLTVVRQKAVPLVSKGKRLASDLRLDLLVGDRVIVESSSSHRRVQGGGRLQQSVRGAGPHLPAAARSQARYYHQLRRSEGEAGHPSRRQWIARMTPISISCFFAPLRLCAFAPWG